MIKKINEGGSQKERGAHRQDATMTEGMKSGDSHSADGGRGLGATGLWGSAGAVAIGLPRAHASVVGHFFTFASPLDYREQFEEPRACAMAGRPRAALSLFAVVVVVVDGIGA